VRVHVRLSHLNCALCIFEENRVKNLFSEFDIDLGEVKQHYQERKVVSKQLRKLLKQHEVKDYCELAVGVSDIHGNYSAYEHKLGPRILENNSYESIFNLAKLFSEKSITSRSVAKSIYESNLPYLKIGVGSEMACMLQPKRLWVGNVRTIWCHLVVKHHGNWQTANEELALYRFDDTSSEMHYKIWRDIYSSMKEDLDTIYELSLGWAEEQGVKVGKKKYLWVDAVCSALYACE
ncbi:hypothetical protein, partial [Vibrio parahaemolyticus]|uniref:hypothetical protein n=2 Tax=Vibrio parahaemolyticus TaxID=670 RepID=UPI00116A7597